MAFQLVGLVSDLLKGPRKMVTDSNTGRAMLVSDGHANFLYLVYCEVYGSVSPPNMRVAVFVPEYCFYRTFQVQLYPMIALHSLGTTPAYSYS